MLIDIRTFRLGDGVSDEAFLTADREAQAIVHRARGAVRRTTARRDDGRWLVLTFWYDAECADAVGDDPLAGLIVEEAVERYDDIGG
ncbi:MAG TPA: hypothetical protein VEA78_01885 [Acidimicrobiales bacterium]|nr:hypothetical protein [Acidimicrobiales bacterium]